MKIAKEYHGNVLVVAAVGELDHHTAGALKGCIQEELAKGRVRNLVLDFTGLSFMDSSGLGVLLGRYKELGKWQGRMLVFGLQPPVEKLFMMTGLNKLIPIQGDLSACLTALGA